MDPNPSSVESRLERIERQTARISDMLEMLLVLTILTLIAVAFPFIAPAVLTVVVLAGGAILCFRLIESLTERRMRRRIAGLKARLAADADKPEAGRSSDPRAGESNPK